METKIATLNVRGLGNTKKRKEMFEWLKTKQYDIYMLQEVHYKKEFNTTWKSDWGNTCVFSGNKSNSEGVAILFNSKHSIEIKQELEIIEGRILLVTIKVHASEFLH